MINTNEANTKLAQLRAEGAFITRSPLAFPEALGKKYVNQQLTGKVIGAEFGIATTKRNEGKQYGVLMLETSGYKHGILLPSDTFPKEGTEVTFLVTSKWVPDRENPNDKVLRYSATDIVVKEEAKKPKRSTAEAEN